MIKAAGISKQRAETSMRFAAFLLVFASGVALSLTQKLLIPSIILMGTTAVAWTRAKKPAKGNFWEVASFCYLIFFLFDLFRFSSGLAPALVHLFIFIMINKIFNLHTYRDYYQLYLLTFLTILAASSLSVEIEMFYMIIIYIFLLVWNILSLTLYREWQKQENDSLFPFSFFHPVYWLLVVGSSLLTFAFALALFFVIPRLQLGYFANLSAGKIQHVSGFSQNVNLGEVGSIQPDANVAMRVKVTFTEAAHPYLYWRGMAFDHYDGHSWSTAKPGNRFLREDTPGEYVNTRNWAPNDQLVKQEFYMAPLDTRVIFGLDRVVRIDGNFGAVTRDDNGTLTGMGRPENYTVYSRLMAARPDELRASNDQIPEAISHYYLQLPDGISPRIGELASKVIKGSRNKYERVIAIKHYLETNYLYSTTDLPQSEDDPVSVFLFKKKAGHCEYFATSMALLLRSVGIPARLVNGFLEGEYNELGDFYVVRQSDAHSWVEVYFDGAWVLFDPSPRNDKIGGPSGRSFLNWINFEKILQSISFFWDRYILIFSGQDQIDAVSYVQQKYQTLRQNVANTSKTGRTFLLVGIASFVQNHRLSLAILIGSIALLILSLRYYQKWRQQQKISRTPILFYQEMLTILKRKGFHRSPEKTPAEFITTVTKELPYEYEKDLFQLTDLFYKSRFGNYELNHSDQANIRQSLRRLQQL